jgi:DAK2 domain fusion protein YloV
VLQTLDPTAARRWATLALSALGEAREEIDALNVFPVPDGDTGTNMYLTLEAAITAAGTVPVDAPVARLAEAFARGALLGARGNSGVIGAQLLRGWAETLVEHGVLNAASAVEGFRRADEQAWRAVNDPVEGTILSVSRAAARAAAQAAAARRAAGQEGSLEAVIVAAGDAARAALELTPTQLPALARAGVVDAGGRGFVVLMDCLAELVLGSTRKRPSRRSARPVVTVRPSQLPAVDFSACAELIGDSPAYEVMFLLDTDPDGESAAIRGLRRALAELGDSLVVVGGGGLWQVHVHVHDAGAAIEVALGHGRPRGIRISHFAEQIAAAAAVKAAADPEGAAPAEPMRDDGSRHRATGTSPAGRERGRSRRRERGPFAGAGLVACAAGPGLADLFTAAGAVVVAGGPGRRPSTAQLLDAVRRTRATHVALLPNDGDTLNVARAAAATARADGVRVTVVPTRAQVQGLAAAAVHDPGRSFDEDVVSMSSAAGAARDGAVTVAVRDGLTSAGECHVGDALGVVDGDFAIVGGALQDVAVEVVERLLSGGGELVTLVVGAGGHEPLARAVAGRLRDRHRQVEVQVLNGGQPRYPLLIGVE